MRAAASRSAGDELQQPGSGQRLVFVDDEDIGRRQHLGEFARGGPAAGAKFQITRPPAAFTRCAVARPGGQRHLHLHHEERLGTHKRIRQV